MRRFEQEARAASALNHPNIDPDLPALLEAKREYEKLPPAKLELALADPLRPAGEL